MLACGWQAQPKKDLNFEVREDAPDGKLIGKGNIPASQAGKQFGAASVPLDAVTDNKLHTIYVIYKGQETIGGGIVSVQFNAK